MSHKFVTCYLKAKRKKHPFSSYLFFVVEEEISDCLYCHNPLASLVPQALIYINLDPLTFVLLDRDVFTSKQPRK